MKQYTFGTRQQIGFITGVVIFLLHFWMPTPDGLSPAGWHTTGVAMLMAIWWITEAVHISVTALLPIVLLPILDVTSISEATTPYANPLIFLFMGGFVIALAMERWDLHKRIAMNIIRYAGVKPSSIIIGFILSSAFLSMWVSNTATALMMLPIGISVIKLVEGEGEESESINFEIVLMLSIAYACNIGGIATLIGTPPNALLAGFMSENYGFEISFVRWMMAGVPLMIISLPILYLVLTKFIYPIRIDELPGGRELIKEEMARLGSISGPEKKVATVFVLTALLWICRPLLSGFIPDLSDAGIAIGAAVSLFLIPANSGKEGFLLSWSDTERIPWGVLILFGGGLSLASAISNTGLADWIGSGVSALAGWSIYALVGLTVFLMVFVTEMTSNTATTAAFLPILASVAVGLGQNPLLLVIPAAIGASCAFMLPVATPPNAIVYGSGKITIPQMSRAGFWLNIIFIALLTIGAFSLISYIFEIQQGVLPPWAL